MADIELPALGESVTEGTITQWFKAVGDEVAEDEPLFEVSTDKVDSEFPSPMAGFLTEILVEEGETIEVGTKVAVISETAGESASAAAEAPAAAEEPAVAEPATAAPVEEPAPAEPVAAAAAEEKTSSALLSPVVRRLLEQAGVDPRSVRGTGAGGRITRADAEEYVRAHGRPAQTTPSAPSAGRSAAHAAAPVVSKAPPRGESVRVPLNKIRRITADHMVRSLETSAHVFVSTEVDYEGVARVRNAHKASFKADEGISLTYLPFIARALIDALAEFPNVNASMGEDHDLVVHGSVGLGIAVDLDYEGLIVPVVREAQDRRLGALARDISNLAGRAHRHELSADDITGGTVTITNIGGTGATFLLPIINQPQVMILSTDAIKRRPVVITDANGSEGIAIHSVGNLTLGWDHRAFDGAYASAFLARVKEILETRDWESEL